MVDFKGHDKKHSLRVHSIRYCQVVRGKQKGIPSGCHWLAFLCSLRKPRHPAPGRKGLRAEGAVMASRQ